MKRVIEIQTPASDVWAALTTPAFMRAWMSDEDIQILTDWQVGRPFIIRGRLHGTDFTNHGTILLFEPETRLRYSHLSSLSRLPDVAGNHSIIDFTLAPAAGYTVVQLELSNFTTEAIEKHLSFYWKSALGSLKRFVEDRAPTIAA